jgi:hypothetical protein
VREKSHPHPAQLKTARFECFNSGESRHGAERGPESFVLATSTPVELGRNIICLVSHAPILEQTVPGVNNQNKLNLFRSRRRARLWAMRASYVTWGTVHNQRLTANRITIGSEK